MECAGCRRLITEQYALRAIGRYFHDECLKCSCCDGPLAEMSRIFYHRDRLVLCLQDYMRLFGRWGSCASCFKDIPPFEWVLKVGGAVFHLACFSCSKCGHRFCVGDKFYMVEHKVLCLSDYEKYFIQ